MLNGAQGGDSSLDSADKKAGYAEYFQPFICGDEKEFVTLQK